MPTAKRKKKKRKAKNAAQVNCKELQQKIDRLGKYFDVCSGVLQKDTTFWFRGQADVSWPLTPSALRFDTSRKQQKAFELLDEFKRLAHMKLKNPPASSENLQWMQLARHYGLPTPLMDWTTNAGIALYFACNVADDNQDGGVFIMNPVSLN